MYYYELLGDFLMQLNMKLLQKHIICIPLICIIMNVNWHTDFKLNDGRPFVVKF